MHVFSCFPLFQSEGFRSVCSFPSSFFLRELLSAYPDAKVVLTVRSADSWYNSVTKSLLPSLHTMRTWPASVAVALRPASDNALQVRDELHLVSILNLYVHILYILLLSYFTTSAAPLLAV